MTAAGPGWAKAPDLTDDPARLAAVHQATERDRRHYLSGGMTEVECRTCHACVLVKKTGPHHTSVQWPAAARERCPELTPLDTASGLRLVAPTCPRMAASIDHAVAEGIITDHSPEVDPDGYW